MDNVDEIITKKNYHELSGDERELISELAGTEEEFEQMKFLFSQMEMMKVVDVLEPRAETKRSLDHLFQETHQQKARGGIWINSVLVALYPVEKPAYRRPALQVAAAVLVILLIIPFFRSDLDPTKTKQLAKNEPKEQVNEPKDTHSIPKEVKEKNKQQKVDVPSTRNKVLQIAETNISFEMDKDISDDLSNEIETVMSSTMVDAAPTVLTLETRSDHPDGVFVGDHVLTSMSAADQPELLDLLTATF